MKGLMEDGPWKNAYQHKLKGSLLYRQEDRFKVSSGFSVEGPS